MLASWHCTLLYDTGFTDALSAVGPDNPFWTWAAPPKQNWVMSWFVANPAPPAAEHPVPVLAANAADVSGSVPS